MYLKCIYINPDLYYTCNFLWRLITQCWWNAKQKKKIYKIQMWHWNPTIDTHTYFRTTNPKYSHSYKALLKWLIQQVNCGMNFLHEIMSWLDFKKQIDYCTKLTPYVNNYCTLICFMTKIYQLDRFDILDDLSQRNSP